MDWVHRARCKDEDPELFFPIGTTGPAAVQIEKARAICTQCGVRAECLEWAMVVEGLGEPCGSAGLGVEVDEEGGQPTFGESCGHRDRGRGLAASAFTVDDRDGAHGAFPANVGPRGICMSQRQKSYPQTGPQATPRFVLCDRGLARLGQRSGAARRHGGELEISIPSTPGATHRRLGQPLCCARSA